METLQNSAHIAGYRLEMIVTNTVHLLIIMILALSMVMIALFADFTGKKSWFALLPLLALAIVGLVIRMDTEIHRMGRFLLFMGDFREAFKRADPLQNLIPLGDSYCLILVLALTVYAETQAWDYFTARFGHLAAIAYAAATILLLAAGSFLAIRAAQSGHAPLPHRQQVQQMFPSKPR